MIDQEVEEALQELIDLDLREETLDSFNKRLEALESLLIEKDVPEDSPEYAILDREAIIAQTVFDEPGLSKKDFQQEKSYGGTYRRIPIKAKHEYDTATISEEYSKRRRGRKTTIEIIWNFNKQGK